MEDFPEISETVAQESIVNGPYPKISWDEWNPAIHDMTFDQWGRLKLEGKVYGKPTDEQYTLAGILHQLMVWMILAPVMVANKRLTMPSMRMLQNG